MLTKQKDMVSFLTKEFSSVGKNNAKKICKLARVSFKTKPKDLNHKEIERLHKAMNMVKLRSPPTNCLSPVDENSLLNGLKKEFPATFYSAVVRRPSVYRGYPFQVEVALAYGEPLKNDQAILLRFANHTPLLYNAGECAITKAAVNVNWRSYGLSQSTNSLPNAPLIILVDVLSVWIPYTSEGKQAIASYPEIIKEITLALQEAGRQLGRHVSKMKKIKQMKIRRGIFEVYSKIFSEYLSKITNKEQEYIKKKLEEILNKGKVEVEKEVKELKEEVIEVK
jgi:DNA topoisomerase-6 subunit B